MQVETPTERENQEYATLEVAKERDRLYYNSCVETEKTLQPEENLRILDPPPATRDRSRDPRDGDPWNATRFRARATKTHGTLFMLSLCEENKARIDSSSSLSVVSALLMALCFSALIEDGPTELALKNIDGGGKMGVVFMAAASTSLGLLMITVLETTIEHFLGSRLLTYPENAREFLSNIDTQRHIAILCFFISVPTTILAGVAYASMVFDESENEVVSSEALLIPGAVVAGVVVVFVVGGVLRAAIKEGYRFSFSVRGGLGSMVGGPRDRGSSAWSVGSGGDSNRGPRAFPESPAAGAAAKQGQQRNVPAHAAAADMHANRGSSRHGLRTTTLSHFTRARGASLMASPRNQGRARMKRRSKSQSELADAAAMARAEEMSPKSDGGVALVRAKTAAT